MRAEAQRRSLELQDAERAERLAAGPQRSPLKGSKVLETVGDAAAELARHAFVLASRRWRFEPHKFCSHRTQGQRAPRRRRGRGGAPAPRRRRSSRRARVRDRAPVQCPGRRQGCGGRALTRVASDKLREAGAARERKQNARAANKAMDAERADRVAAHGKTPLASPSSKAMKSVSITPRAADAPPPPPPETQASTESLDTACTKATKTCAIA